MHFLFSSKYPSMHLQFGPTFKPESQDVQPLLSLQVTHIGRQAWEILKFNILRSQATCLSLS
jgi:hypothetical protein